MRIVHVISTPGGLGGAERVLAAIAQGTEARGWDQMVLNPFADSREGSELKELLPDVPFMSKRCPHIWSIPRLMQWAYGVMKSFQPDIVHAHLFHALALMAAVPVSSGSLMATHHHGNVSSLRGRTIRPHIDRWAVRRYERVIAVSGAVASYLEEQVSASPPTIEVIRNGWTGDPEERRSHDQAYRLICVGNFRYEKGHSTLLKGFAQVARDESRLQLLLVGDGPLRSNLEAEAAELGVSDRVKFEGMVADIWPYLARSDVFVLPSLYEPLGIAAMEAMAAGLPVIATATGGLVELVQEGITGYLVPPGDPESLALKIRHLLNDGSLRRAMGERAREESVEMTMEKTVEAYLDLYVRLAEDHRRDL